jgi:hypothetical protein
MVLVNDERLDQGTAAVLLSDPAGGAPQPLSAEGEIALDGMLAPQGDHAVWSTPLDGGSAIVLVTVAGSRATERRTVLASSMRLQVEGWSPSGDQLVVRAIPTPLRAPSRCPE